MAVKFPLKMADGAMVRTLEELREHFDLKTVLAYYDNGRLAKWLENGYYDKEAKEIRALADPESATTTNAITELCGILGIDHSQSQAKQVHFSSVVRENKRLERLKQYTADDAILAAVDRVAFDQEELVALLNSGVEEVYLCGDRFIIPEEFENVTYQCVNAPSVSLGRIMEFEKGAEQGDADAQYKLGKCYAHGDGVGQNDKAAARWYRLAAEQGYVKAQYCLGKCYDTGRGVEQDYKEAVKWYRLAAEQGYAKAQYCWGKCYDKGHGVEQDYKEAVKWYRLAAEQGYAAAQYELGYSYSSGLKSSFPGWDLDCDIFAFNWKPFFGGGQDYKEAVKWYRLAAEQRYAKAQCYLGKCYYIGIGVEEDYKEAVRWCRLAAEQGYAVAQSKLGTCYYNGTGVEEDCKEAAKWYRLAAEQRYAEAQYGLGRCYLGQQDFEEAVKWFRLAAEQGYAKAQNELAHRYEVGSGVPKNLEEAKKWYKRAAEQGYGQASQNYENLCKQQKQDSSPVGKLFGAIQDLF